MFITVKCTSSITKGDVLSFNSSSQLWELASSFNTPLGVANQNAFVDQDDTSRYLVSMSIEGHVLAKASRDIPNEGGELNVENGGVYVDNNANHTGIIAPNYLDQAARVAGDLVTVIIR
jgi:hypothetical protein